MKAFLSRLGLFSGILALIIIAITILVPATPRSRTSLLFAKLDKDQLLRDTPPPRLIVIGGSNMSMGIDSGILESELGIHPINTAIHASIGLAYLADSILEYIQPGDIVVVSLEYSQFFGSHMYGGEELLRTVFDVDRASLGSLDFRQWASILRFVPKYAISKIKPGEYYFKEPEKIGIYERAAFNEFGDASIHWTRAAELIEPYPEIDQSYNPRAVDVLIDLGRQIAERGGKMLITYPAIQEESFHNMAEQIKQVQGELEKSGLMVMGTPERYIVADRLLHDTPYHLTYEGVQQRTLKLIEDLISAGALEQD